MKSIAVLIAALALGACNTGPSLKSKTVQLTKVESDVTDCKLLGEVSGQKGWGFGNGSAIDEMTNKAAQLNADVVLYHGTMTGVAGKAYDCAGRYSKGTAR